MFEKVSLGDLILVTFEKVHDGDNLFSMSYRQVSKIISCS